MEKTVLTEQREEILRLRKVREDLGYTQEQFAHVLDISLSAYKKIETYNRRISLGNLKILHEKLNVSVDYILFGDKASQEQAWKELLNCTETDKILVFLRLFRYLTTDKPEIFPVDDVAFVSPVEIIQSLTEGLNAQG
ncbi:MAG: helix-turn-helix transcriptional regulator [Lachnospiraceae bacterium]|nr:helix-turn-helix transcriptional regulator [Lachnospiraceae bacterium]